jgi:hypothetical protein
MKTLKEELQGCLSEMQATAKKFEELMNTPGITWPELECVIRKGERAVLLSTDGTMGYEVGDIVTATENDFSGGWCNFYKPGASVQLFRPNQYIKINE